MTDSDTDTPGDWPEDFEHENGCYANKCGFCGNMFTGHKSRVSCKACVKGDKTIIDSNKDKQGSDMINVIVLAMHNKIISPKEAVEQLKALNQPSASISMIEVLEIIERHRFTSNAIDEIILEINIFYRLNQALLAPGAKTANIADGKLVDIQPTEPNIDARRDAICKHVFHKPAASGGDMKDTCALCYHPKSSSKTCSRPDCELKESGGEDAKRGRLILTKSGYNKSIKDEGEDVLLDEGHDKNLSDPKIIDAICQRLHDRHKDWVLEGGEDVREKVDFAMKLVADYVEAHEAWCDGATVETKGKLIKTRNGLKDQLTALFDEQDQWRPISDAPKDGTEILGWAEECGVVFIRWIAPCDFLNESDDSNFSDEDWEEPDWFYADFVSGGRLCDCDLALYKTIKPPQKGE